MCACVAKPTIENCEERAMGIHLVFIKVRNSSRVFCCARKRPSMHDVTVVDPGFWTPRIVMQRWLATVVRMATDDNAFDLRCFNHDSNPTRFYCFSHSDGNLLCESFLNLQAATESLRNTG
jgi:hypothetical protein